MVAAKDIKLKPIGYVRRASRRKDIKDRSLVSRIVVRKDLVEALDGIEGFSHVFVVFYMHKIPKDETKILKVHPRGRTDLPLLGIFATRSAYRPNPIGLTLVELIERKSNVLVVKGLDALDGSLVLDIKPFNSRDMVLDARVPEWHKRLSE